MGLLDIAGGAGNFSLHFELTAFQLHLQRQQLQSKHMITKAQIDEIVRRIVEHCHPEKVILFGSYAHGTAKEDSDLDLAIVAKTDLPKFKRAIPFEKAIRHDGKRWLFGMDILVYTPEEMEAWKDNQYSMVHEILSTGKTLYDASEQEYEDLFKMDKSQVRIVKLTDPNTDFQYWQSQPSWKRLATLEAIRREYHGWDYETEPRLQRVYSITRRA